MQLLLVPVRTSRQGVTLNAGKLKADYRDETTTVELHPDDMARLGLVKGDRVRLTAGSGHAVVVRCKAQKGEEATPGLAFMAYGPSSSQLMEADTAGTGMPLSKHIPVEVDGPLDEEGRRVAPAAPAIPSASPLSAAQAGPFAALLATLPDATQSAWLSGYFAALGGGASPAPGAPAPRRGPEITLLHGSQTGNGEGLATRLHERLLAGGLAARLCDMADYDLMQLERERLLFLIVSTHGEGDPPIAAEKLHAHLHGDGAPRLEALNYAVFALGDSSYKHFCQTGKDFDGALEKLGARRLLARVDADVDFEEPGEAWAGAVLDACRAHAGAGAAPGPAASSPAAAGPAYGKTRPYPALIRNNINLNGAGSAKQTCHIEIALGASGLSYEPGDALGVFPRNNSTTVCALLAALGMDGAAPVTLGTDTLPLEEALSERLDCTALSRVMAEKYAALPGAAGAGALLDAAHPERFDDYAYGRHILDLVRDHPPTGATAQDFVQTLRRVPARLYSIASSLKAHPGEVHLIVAAVRYHAHGADREGVCSTFLCDRVGVDGTLPVYVQPNKHFRLPQDPATPIILIGPGTGVAPFRAFLEEREVTGASGRNWLFFGDQRRATDYLYGDEWEARRNSGLLTRLDLAFSRDQEHKIYVQDRLLENAREVYAWLEDGACVYVCGDAARMASDVHKALVRIVAEQGGLDAERAEAYVAALAETRRYLRDVY